MSKATDLLTGVPNIAYVWQHVYMELICMCFKSSGGKPYIMRFSPSWRKHGRFLGNMRQGLFYPWGAHSLCKEHAIMCKAHYCRRYANLLQLFSWMCLQPNHTNFFSWCRVLSKVNWFHLKSIQHFAGYHRRFFTCFYILFRSFFVMFIRKSKKNKKKLELMDLQISYFMTSKETNLKSLTSVCTQFVIGHWYGS